MEKIKEMDINKETAMRLWNQAFGKSGKVKDFSGRMMAKGAYNDRNSEFGWNVDHILPQSKGGVTADHNLICCNIQTNDEKANKFPCFKANGNAFEIVKVQNHYEIHAKDKSVTTRSQDDELNLYDSAAGIRFFKSLKGMQNKHRFVGTVYIYLQSVKNSAVIEFIEKIFEKESISYGSYASPFSPALLRENPNVKVTVTDYDMPLQSDIQELLDKCILLNTYLSAYFYECEYIQGFEIYFRGDYFEDRAELFGRTITEPVRDLFQHRNFLFINDLIISNTDAREKVKARLASEYTEFNYVCTKLKENLEKEVNG